MTMDIMRLRVLILSIAIFVGFMVAGAQSLRRYNAYISFPKGAMTGVCLVRTEANGDGVMSVVNEFGIKAFDATYSARTGKVKLLNVVKMLNRWYIRRVVAADLVAVFNPAGKLPKHRTVEVDVDGAIVLTNTRMNIVYQLQPIATDAEE